MMFVLGVFVACDDETRRGPLVGDADLLDAALPTTALDAAKYTEAGGNAGDALAPPLVAPTGPSPFGKICDSAADCAAGLLCLGSESNDWLGGGPAHGYCSLDCTADPALCLAFDARARCLTGRQMAEAYCMKGCTLGDATGEGKCADRPDLSCAHVGLLPVCMPTCGGDEDCPAGRYCNQTDGICVDGERTGDPPGVQCDPAAHETTCDAYCSTLSDGSGVCSGLCTIGVPYACNVPAGETEVVGLPVCMSFTGNDSGDVGICVQRCRCNADCDHPSAYCDLDRPEATDGIGVCLYDFAADAGTRGMACSDSDAALPDAAVDDGDL